MKRKFDWQGLEVEREKLKEYAKDLKKFSDHIDEWIEGDDSHAIKFINIARYGKSNNTLWMGYVQLSDQIHSLCKKLIVEHNLDLLVIISEYQKIAFPNGMSQWQQRIHEIMTEEDVLIIIN